MTATQEWLEALLRLPRPEYARQPEALLTDLLWGSEGSNRTEPRGDQDSVRIFQNSLTWNVGDGRSADRARLVPRLKESPPGGIAAGTTFPRAETLPIARSFDPSALLAKDGVTPSAVECLLDSLVAPRARMDKSLACVPIHPDLAVLQTLPGIVNKRKPPDLARAIERVGYLGGAPSLGSIARTFLGNYEQPADAAKGVTGLLDALSPAIANHTWLGLAQLPGQAGRADGGLPEWGSVGPRGDAGTTGSEEPFGFPECPPAPFRWFWEKWSTLCSQSGDGSSWFECLSARRFVDWATCLLRTGLAFAYIWEARFFAQVGESIVAVRDAGRPERSAVAIQTLERMLREPTVLASIEPRQVPATRKDVSKVLFRDVVLGYLARAAILDHGEFHENDVPEFTPLPDSISDPSGRPDLARWVRFLAEEHSDLVIRRSPSRNVGGANNTREFIRYLLIQRTADDDTADQADFYSLGRTGRGRSGSFWIDPGPEWLVVVTSLLGRRPGGACTLGQVIEDLRLLGLRVERRVIVALLEEIGLTTDSPDADDALVIRSAF